jgi:putative lipoic acid-binding regulatory protein
LYDLKPIKPGILNNLNFNNNPFDKNDNSPEVDFPVNFDLKVVLEAEAKMDIQRRNLELVLEDADVNHNFVKSKQSSRGNFVSLTMNITLENMKQMQYLYRRLKLLPGIRFAV